MLRSPHFLLITKAHLRSVFELHFISLNGKGGSLTDFKIAFFTAE